MQCSVKVWRRTSDTTLVALLSSHLPRHCARFVTVLCRLPRVSPLTSFFSPSTSWYGVAVSPPVECCLRCLTVDALGLSLAVPTQSLALLVQTLYSFHTRVRDSILERIMCWQCVRRGAMPHRPRRRRSLSCMCVCCVNVVTEDHSGVAPSPYFLGCVTPASAARMSLQLATARVWRYAPRDDTRGVTLLWCMSCRRPPGSRSLCGGCCYSFCHRRAWCVQRQRLVATR
jgi:hypothetical protein